MSDLDQQQIISTMSEQQIDELLQLLIRAKVVKWKQKGQVPSYPEMIDTFLLMILEPLLNADDPWTITKLSNYTGKNYGTLRRKVRSLGIRLKWKPEYGSESLKTSEAP